MQPQTNFALTNVSVKGSGKSLGISLIAALAGFIFGFDTVVISGANLPIKWSWDFGNGDLCGNGFFLSAEPVWQPTSSRAIPRMQVQISEH